MPVSTNNDYFIKINCEVSQDGYRPSLLDKMPFLAKRKNLRFFIEKNNISEPFDVKWKIRNFGQEAKNKNDLRGEIKDDCGRKEKKEKTSYKGEHFVECYIIKDGMCIAINRLDVPIEK